jgi:hypothetical protein
MENRLMITLYSRHLFNILSFTLCDGYVLGARGLTKSLLLKQIFVYSSMNLKHSFFMPLVYHDLQQLLASQRLLKRLSTLE